MRKLVLTQIRKIALVVDKDGRMQVLVCLYLQDQIFGLEDCLAQAQDCHLASIKIRGKGRGGALVDKDGSMGDASAGLLGSEIGLEDCLAQAQDCHLASAKIRGGQTEDYRLQTMIAALKIGRLQFDRIVR